VIMRVIFAGHPTRSTLNIYNEARIYCGPRQFHDDCELEGCLNSHLGAMYSSTFRATSSPRNPAEYLTKSSLLRGLKLRCVRSTGYLHAYSANALTDNWKLQRTRRSRARPQREPASSVDDIVL